MMSSGCAAGRPLVSGCKETVRLSHQRNFHLAISRPFRLLAGNSGIRLMTCLTRAHTETHRAHPPLLLVGVDVSLSVETGGRAVPRCLSTLSVSGLARALAAGAIGALCRPSRTHVSARVEARQRRRSERSGRLAGLVEQLVAERS